MKMVTNTRGKLRRVKWNRLFKDGSFNKLKVRESGVRVRTMERMREIKQDKAEAKFERELRQTKKELGQAEDQIKVRDKEAENRKKKQEMVARQVEKEKKNQRGALMRWSKS